MYGDIVNLPRYLDETGYDGPLMVTEWGAIGHWEVGKTAWGAPIEQNSSDKAANYLKSHEIAIASRPDQTSLSRRMKPRSFSAVSKASNAFSRSAGAWVSNAFRKTCEGPRNIPAFHR